MPKDDIPKLIEDFLYAQQHGLLKGNKGRAVSKAFHHGIVDDFVRGQIQEPVRKAKIAQAFIGPFHLPRLNRGEIIQGIDIKKNKVLIPLQLLCSHSLSLATVGSGKTLKALFHALQIARYVKGLWLIDCRKAEFVKLKLPLQKLGINLIVLHARQLRINPLQVPYKVSPYDWIARVSDMLVMVLELPPRATKVLQIALHRLYRRFGIFEGKQLFPTLHDLLKEIVDDKDANPQARYAIIDSLQTLLDALGPEVLAYRRGWTTQQLSTKAINFILGGVPDVGANLILNTLLLSEFTSRLSQGISNCPINLYCSVDEGQRITSTSTGIRNALADVWVLLRGTGCALDISVPASHGLMPEALSFTSTKYLGRCGSAADYETMAKNMGFSKIQTQWAIHNTRPGRWLAQIGEGEHRYPYVLDIPLMKFPPQIDVPTDDIGELASLPFVRAEEFFSQDVSVEYRESDSESQQSILNNTQYRFCKSVGDNPLKPSNSYHSPIGMSSKTAKKIREQLVAKGLLREQPFDSGRRGGRAILLELKEQAVRSMYWLAGRVCVLVLRLRQVSQM